MKKLLVVTTLFACFSAHAFDAEESAQAAAVADGVSTAVVLANGAIESNPVVNAAGLWPITVAKIALPYTVRNASPEVRKTVLAGGTGVWGGAAIANTLLWLVPGIRELRFLVAIPAGLYMGHKAAQKVDQEEAEKLAALERTEVALAELGD